MTLTKEEIIDLWKAIEVAKMECKDEFVLCYLYAMKESGILYGQLGIKVQLTYCLSNMQNWRGKTAKRVKTVFRNTINKLK